MRKRILPYKLASKYLPIFMEGKRDVYHAIADPTRRAIINMVAKKPLPVNAIAEQFIMTRQAISLHVKILNECGLLSFRKQGRERYCEARLEKLQEVSAWVDQYKTFWNAKLDALGQFLDQTDTPTRIKKPKSQKGKDNGRKRKSNKRSRRV